MTRSVPTTWRRSHLRALLALSTTFALILAPLGAQVVDASNVIRTYDIRYQTTTHGSIALIGNTIVTCPNANPACAGARDGSASGGAANNNSYAMVLVDIDGDATTADSSRATLALPAGATVEFAGLYWQATSVNAARDTVKLAVPGTAYATVTATTVDTNAPDIYAAFADVTAQVNALADPNGDYTVADIQATTGANRHGGWSLVIAYDDPAQPLRNLTVFDGFAVVNAVAPTSITTAVSGFVTPSTGTVNAEVGLVSGEGDLGLTGDQFQIGGVNVSDANNPTTNVFNSTISDLGTTVTTKLPNYVNQLGWDVDRLDATGLVPNGATTANLTFTTGGETYYPQALTFAVDVFEPHLDATKDGVDVNAANLVPGDQIQYTVDVINNGNDPATDVVLTDPIPASTTYVPGSLQILSGANAGAKTDAAGDDQGEVVAGIVTVRLGAGADATNGGTLGIGATTSIRFRVSVDAGTAGATTIVNQASLGYRGQTLGAAFSAVSDSDSGTAGDQPDDLITAAPSPPVAVADSATVVENGSGIIDVLANDTDPDSDIDPTSVTVTVGPTNGTVAINPTTGAITYTPNASFVGGDTFTYQVCDLTALCDTATVTVTVTAAPQPPVANADSATVAEDGSTIVDVVANDTDPDGDLDPTTVSVTSGPTSGTVSVNPTTGAITYTPDPNFSGLDSFTYQVCDATALCDTATVSVTVTPGADPPVAAPDSATVSENGSASIDVLGNDTDPDGDLDPTSVTVTTGPSHGTVSVNPTTGAITYTPDPGYSGPDSFTYQVCDATALCDTATVTLDVVNVPNTALTAPPAPTPPPASDSTWMFLLAGIAAAATFVLAIGLSRGRRRT